MVDNEQILKEINLARTKPSEYAEKLLSYEKHFSGDILRFPGLKPIKTMEGFKAFQETADFLKGTKPLNPIIFNSFLNQISNDVFSVVEKSSDADEINSINIDDFISKYGQIAGQFSQAVDFGSATAELVISNLLVDEGDINKGNRHSIMNPKFTIAGISSGKHKTFHNSTIICFARHFIPTGEEPENLSDDCYEESPKDESKEVADKKIANTSEVNEITDKLKSLNNDKEQNPKYVYVKESKKNDEFDLPIGVERMEKHEKIITEDGIKRKLIKETRYMKDGTIETDIYKTNI